MHVPGLRSAMLAIDPEGLAERIRRHVVIAAHLVAIPPSRLDSLRARDQFQRALAARIALQRDEALRAIQQPRGAQRKNGVRYGLLVSLGELRIFRGSLRECVPDTIFRPVVAGDRDAEHAILPQARGQALEEPFAIES